MKKLLKEKKAITLIALVITIVVLVILAAVVISMTVGNDGLIAKAIKAANDYKNAQEKDKQGINDLYGELVVATDGTVTMDITELKKLINTSIDEKNQALQEKITNLETDLSTAQTQIVALKSVNNSNANRLQIIKRDRSLYGSVLSANTWHQLARVNLNNYGTGKAIISCSLDSNDYSSANLEILVRKNGAEIANDRDYSGSTSTAWRRISATACIDYNPSTYITFESIFTTAMNPGFFYQILLIPNGQTIE